MFLKLWEYGKWWWCTKGEGGTNIGNVHIGAICVRDREKEEHDSHKLIRKLFFEVEGEGEMSRWQHYKTSDNRVGTPLGGETGVVVTSSWVHFFSRPNHGTDEKCMVPSSCSCPFVCALLTAQSSETVFTPLLPVFFMRDVFPHGCRHVEEISDDS